MSNSPFSLHDNTQYKKWRARKLGAFSKLHKRKKNLFINIDDPSLLTNNERRTILDRCNQHGLCLYRINPENPNYNTKKSIHALTQQLSLVELDNNLCADEDRLSSITHSAENTKRKYIPYSTKKLSWHTDGYYNKPEQTINAMLLHCQKPAKSGGVSFLLDHEIAYILLRDKNPDYIKGLMRPDAMTIPANIFDGEIIRDEQTGPVFSINSQGQLHMRYSARKRNIEWKESAPIINAVAFLNQILQSDTPFIIKHKLKAGEGLICRNVLHCRTHFVDYDDPDKKRLLYRGRFYNLLPKPS